MIEFYDMMFKRKSFRQFKCKTPISKSELQDIENFLGVIVEQLSDDVTFKYKIVPSNITTCKRGEYCILIYGNHDNRSLLNIGYTFALLDFFLSSIDIGSCWYGMGKPIVPNPINNLPYVIMIAIGKATKEEFRKNYKTAKRKENADISVGKLEQSLLEYVKYSPSACNSQPWMLIGDDNGFSIKLNPKEKMLIPKNKISFYNTIDVGIMMLSCEIWLMKNSIKYKREINAKKEQYQKDDTVVNYKYGKSLDSGKTDFA